MANFYKRMLSLVLGVILLTLTALPALAAEIPAAQSLPTERSAAAEYIAQHYSDGYYSAMLEGYYKTPVRLESSNGPIRDLWMYVPEDSYYAQPTVFIMTPNGYGSGDGATDPYEFLVESGWKEISDEEKIVAVLMTPDEKNGNVWGDYDAEKQYLTDACDYILKKPFIFNSDYNKYIAAYGEADVLGTKLAINEAKWWAGALIVGSSGLDSAYISQMQSEDSYITGVPKSEVPVPMWIVSPEKTADVAGLIAYWKNANDTEAAATPSDLADEYYAPDQTVDVGQPDSEPVAAVYYTKADSTSVMNSEFAGSVWENLFKGVRRYPSFGNWSLRAYTPLEELGATMYKALVPGGETPDGIEYDLDRNWYVYVPDSVDTSQKNPVLFLFNARSGFNSEIPGRTGWLGVCEEEGIILVTLSPSIYVRTDTKNGMIVHPLGTGWNTSASMSSNLYRPNDLLFVDYVHEWLRDEANGYADIIDEGRFYAAGQSAGGSFTHNIIAHRPQLFAGAAPISSISTPGNNANLSVDIPVINMMGQEDEQMINGFAEANGVSIFNHYISRYNLADPEGKTAHSDFTFMQESSGGTSICTDSEGLMNKYIFQTANGYPMFEAVEVVDMVHATIPSILPEAWKFMENYSRDLETGVLYYNGEVVDSPVNLELAHQALKLTTDAHNVKAGETFKLETAFAEEQESNTAILNYTWDGDLFKFAYFYKADGVTLLGHQYGDGWAKITLMAPDYDLEELGVLDLTAKDNAPLVRGWESVKLDIEYVLRDVNGDKSIENATTSARFTTVGNGPNPEPYLPGDTNDDGVVDIMDLSNMIDWFGYTSQNQSDWDDWYTFFDFNNDGEIDISDIAHVARLI